MTRRLLIAAVTLAWLVAVSVDPAERMAICEYLTNAAAQ